MKKHLTTIPITEKELEVSGFKVWYADKEILKELPASTGPIEFFAIGKSIGAKELEAEYTKRGLVPAPHALVAAHKENPNLAEEKPFTASQWKDANGNFCCATFHRWGGRRGVGVGRDGGGWSGAWWFSGVRLVPQALGTQDSALHSEPLPSALPDLLTINGTRHRKEA